MSKRPDLVGPVLLQADDWKDYALLDSGAGRKLEKFGSQVVSRPDPQAFWAPKDPAESWKADATFSASGDDERGNWQTIKPNLPEDWKMRWNGLQFEVRRAPFRHLGVFQEHSVHWQHAIDKIRGAGRPIRLLNLFGYTGMMSLAAASAGAEVTHLDASPKSNGYGKDNQALSGLNDRTIRWISDDALKFMRREVRRESKYDAIVLDPPKFGRGPKNETWRLEENLPELLELCRQCLTDQPLFMITTVYAVRLSYLALAQTVRDHLDGLGGVITAGEMVIPERDRDVMLPTAIFARWDA